MSIMPPGYRIIQQHYRVDKKHSLVLNGCGLHDRCMTTNDKTSRGRRLRTFVRDAWTDQLRASKALLELQPYDDYLINRRSER